MFSKNVNTNPYKNVRQENYVIYGYNVTKEWVLRALPLNGTYCYDVGRRGTDMGRTKKDINVEVGARLRDIRENKQCSQAEFAAVLGIGDEHYRKLESGATGLTMEKVYLLNQKCDVDPTFLISGRRSEEFDFDRYITNCSREQKDKLLTRVLEYMKSYFNG